MKVPRPRLGADAPRGSWPCRQACERDAAFWAEVQTVFRRRRRWYPLLHAEDLEAVVHDYHRTYWRERERLMICLRETTPLDQLFGPDQLVAVEDQACAWLTDEHLLAAMRRAEEARRRHGCQPVPAGRGPTATRWPMLFPQEIPPADRPAPYRPTEEDADASELAELLFSMVALFVTACSNKRAHRICQARLDAVGVPDNVVAVRQLVLWALPLIDPRGFEREPVGVALDSAQVDEIRFYLLLLSGALAGLCESEAARVEARRLLQSARGGVLDELAIRRLLKEDSQAILSSAGPLSEPVAYRFLDPAARVRLLRHKLLVRHRERSSHE